MQNHILDHRERVQSITQYMRFTLHFSLNQHFKLQYRKKNQSRALSSDER